MHRRILLLLSLCACIAGLSSTRAERMPRPAAKQHAPAISFENDIKPMLAEYCYGCHGEQKKKADLSLQSFASEADVLKDRRTWERVLTSVRNREMPPENKPQPSQKQRDLLAHWVEEKVFQTDCTNPDPGRVTIRRLNRAEYNNTIRDLVGVDFHPADDFPADDSGYGFDNIGDALSMPPILFEKYLEAAEKILDAAIVSEDPMVKRTRRFAADTLEADSFVESKGGGWANIGREGEIFTAFRFPANGEYVLRVNVYGDQAGNEPARMGFRLGGKEVQRVDVPNEAEEPRVYEVRVQTEAGTNRVGVAFLNNFRDPKNPNRKRRDRNLVVEYLEIEGPFNPKPTPLPETHRRIFTRTPATNAPVKVKLAAAREILGQFARRAYRRPVTKTEVERLVELTGMALRDGENFHNAVKVGLQAALVSPHFLFRGEVQPDPNNPSAVVPVDEFALASRLSYFLWSSMPDAELLALAERGKLRKNLEPQVRRMLKDPRAHALVENFAGQWLQTRSLALVTPDTKEFPDFDDALRAAMARETELLFENIVREDRSLLEFLTADYTFVNARLARHYGLPGVDGGAFQKVSLRGTDRGGVLTHASILTLTSNPTRTSPVKRGKWVLENILGTPPPPAPPNVPELKDQKQLTGTLRQKMEQHRENPNCASCHARMDPIGFSFEHFDGIGKFRETDAGQSIDPSGKLVSGESFANPEDLRRLLVTAKRDDYVRNVSRKMLTYALGRGLEHYDKCAVDQISAGLEKKEFRFSALVVEIVKSTPFQMRRGEQGHEAKTASTQ